MFSTIVYLRIESNLAILHGNLQRLMLLVYEISIFAGRCPNAKNNGSRSTSASDSLQSFFLERPFSEHSSFLRACLTPAYICADVELCT